MAEAVTLAKLHPAAEVDQALGIAAIAGRFAENDLLRILTHNTGRDTTEPSRASEDHSLQPGTSAWSSFGLPANDLSRSCAKSASFGAERFLAGYAA